MGKAYSVTDSVCNLSLAGLTPLVLRSGELPEHMVLELCSFLHPGGFVLCGRRKTQVLQPSSQVFVQLSRRLPGVPHMHSSHLLDSFSGLSGGKTSGTDVWLLPEQLP